MFTAEELAEFTTVSGIGSAQLLHEYHTLRSM
jgi:hypothetical protein